MKKSLLFLLLLCVSIYCVNAQTTIGLTQPDAGNLEDGYILFAPISSTTTYLVDKCGKQVKTWSSTYRPGQSCYILPDGTLLRSGNTNNATFNAGGSGGVIQKIDWNGNVTWTYTVSDATKCQHHDVKALPNGNVLVIAWESKTNTEAIAQGRNPSLVPTTVWSEQILEIQPVGATGGNVVWEWHLWDHLVQDFSASKPNYGVVNANPRLLNLNYKASATNSDWIHLNSIDYNAALDQILLSSHGFNEVWIIDHSTTSAQAATHTGGNSGKGGDILYRWGNPQAYNTGTTTQLFGQHDAKWIESGYPFQNQIMIFNNGNGRTGGNYSTVEIINPPVNGYNYTATLPYLPTTTSWTYNAGNPNSLYAQNISGAQQLSNGNVLFCNGPVGTFTEVNSVGTAVWKYVNPVTTTGVLTQGATAAQNLVFRCTFYPKTYSGFTGRTLTASSTIETTNTNSSTCKTTNPELYSWVRNLTNSTGYNNVISNVKNVNYTTTDVYVSANCIPGYNIGPWMANPNTPASKNFVFKITRTPVPKTGTATAIGLGHTGIWSNGVSVFNAWDGMSYNNAGVWKRDALFWEGISFDNCLGHAAGNGEYHHHVSPSCLYDINANTCHSPIIGYAFDGYPIYGAYAYTNVNGTGAIKRMESSYVITTTSTRTNGPAVSTTYPAGCYMEDFTYTAGAGDLDARNGRFCVTPEYPNGTYCYFATLNAQLTPQFPYTMYGTYYGVVQTGNTGAAGGANTIPTTAVAFTTLYSPTISIAANTTTICAGASVTFTATITKGGCAPTYQWKKNGINIATGSIYTTSNLANNDVISCDLTSNDAYLTTKTATATYNVSVQSCGGTKVAAKIFLNNVNTTSLLMDNYVAALADFPLSDPYRTAPLNTNFIHVNNPTVETTTAMVLSATGNNAIVDWVFLELRTGVSGATTVAYTKAGLLQSDGDIVGMDGISPVEFSAATAGNYYVTVRHRNNLGFRTNASIALSNTATTLNFTNNGISLYGVTPLNTSISNRYIMNSGDGNADGSIDGLDSAVWENENGNFNSYLFNSDYNLDASVDAVDSAIWELNNGKYQELD
jgi:hypothetical protein